MNFHKSLKYESNIETYGFRIHLNGLILTLTKRQAAMSRVKSMINI